MGGLIQIVGGVLSIYGLYKSAFNPNYELFISLIIVIPLVFLNFTAGVSVLVFKSPKGVILLAFNYFLQVLQFKFKGLYYFYAIGPYLGLGFVKKANQSVSFWWDGSEYIFTTLIRFVDDNIGYFFTVNFVALFFLLVIVQEYRNRKTLVHKSEA